MKYYLHVLNYDDLSYINIGLTEKESEKYEMYECEDDFIKYEHIAEKYGFNPDKSAIMFSKKNTIYYK